MQDQGNKDRPSILYSIKYQLFKKIIENCNAKRK